ncbi:MAG TPA: BON domain-containing protein [Burkholderiaceae bacterium]|jgi:osmotically-inducible protein OsmY|nr:BON domain-containing protein [Burkholderiaceae bacterium]
MSHKPSLMIPALSAVVAALALLGCQKTNETQTTGEKVGQTMERAKEATKGAADTAASKMSDATITAEVNTALAKDPDLSALKIDVDTANGRVVLHGKAPSPAARDRATQLAQNVKGVVSVDNQLVVSKS